MAITREFGVQSPPGPCVPCHICIFCSLTCLHTQYSWWWLGSCFDRRDKAALDLHILIIMTTLYMTTLKTTYCPFNPPPDPPSPSPTSPSVWALVPAGIDLVMHRPSWQQTMLPNNNYLLSSLIKRARHQSDSELPATAHPQQLLQCPSLFFPKCENAILSLLQQPH